MGTDIHLHVEVKINNKWEHYTRGSFERDYRLFAKIANVRNDGNIVAISEPKGLPEDITTVTAFEENVCSSYGHSHSWLSSEEVSVLERWYEEITSDVFLSGLSRQLGYFFGNSFASFISHPEDYPDGVQDFRWVFWFR